MAPALPTSALITARRALLASLFVGMVAHAQQGGPTARPVGMSADEMTGLAQGWTLLAQGDAAKASASASALLIRDPNSVAALALVVESQITLGGPMAGLRAYESWKGARSFEEPFVLRRVARALLRTHARPPLALVAQIAAARALAADGDPDATDELMRAAERDTFPQLQAMAGIGNERAVYILIADIHLQTGDRSRLIDALVDSGSTLAIPVLVEQLSDPNEKNRAAGARGLGRLGAVNMTPALRPLLDDARLEVKDAAAEALYELGDNTGLPHLMKKATSEFPAVRISAAVAMKSRPDPAWRDLVRGMAGESDPLIRLEVARLIGPFEPELSRSLFDRLLLDENPEIRRMTAQTMTHLVVSDFTMLRGLLKSSDPDTAVGAADRILQLTR